MTISEKIWRDGELDLYDKLILGLLKSDGSKKPQDIAKELQVPVKRVNQKINRMSKEGRLSIIITRGDTRVEVHNEQSA